MGTSVSLTQNTLSVDPGSAVSTEMRVRNTGDVVDQFSFQPLGDGAGWISVDPPTVRLFPDTDAVVRITIAPPRLPTSKAGVTTWAVKAQPKEDPSGSATAEGTVDVGSFVELGAELQPVTGRGRLTGKFELAIDNRGNTAVPVRINGTDSEQALGFEVDPPQVDSEPGSAHFAKLRVHPGQKIWKGQPKNHPFQIAVEPQARTQDGGEEGAVAAQPIAPIVLNGNLLQEPIIPKWFLKALLATIAALIALFIIWKTLLKPSVESAAREVAIEEVAPVSSAIQAIEPAVEEAAQQAEAAADDAAAAAEDAAAAGGAGEGGGGGGGALGNVFNETTQPTNFRLSVATGVNSAASAATEPLPANQTFALTDMVLQNPRGDAGFVRVFINEVLVQESALDNFRDLDFHYVAPYVVQAGQTVRVELVCAEIQLVPGDPCDAAVSFAGFTTTVTEVPATTAPAG